jgi:hypothetical protein
MRPTKLHKPRTAKSIELNILYALYLICLVSLSYLFDFHHNFCRQGWVSNIYPKFCESYTVGQRRRRWWSRLKR